MAILGAGRIRDQVVARQGQAAVRRVVPLSLTFDHRVVTGGRGNPFSNGGYCRFEQRELTRMFQRAIPG